MPAVITHETPLGGMRYPFFEPLKKWQLIITRPEDEEVVLPRYPYLTAAWISDKGINQLYSNWTWEKFRDWWHLSITSEKGVMSMSKRMSRAFRPMFLYGFYRGLNIHLDGRLNKSAWDGAGLISRRMVMRLTESLGHVQPLRAKQLIRDAKHAKRVEFTVVGSKGQLKGHAVVVEDAPWDFRLPADAKGEFKKRGKIFVSIDLPHAANTMLIDQQSMVNLGEFIPFKFYERWIEEHHQDYLSRMQSGDIQNDIANTVQEPGTGWEIAEYFYSGGEWNWFQGPKQALIRQHVKSFQASMKG